MGDLLYDLGFLEVHTNIKLIMECSGAKMSLSWKQLLSKEKGMDDGGMQVYTRCSDSIRLDQLYHICTFFPRSNIINSSNSTV